MKAISHLIAATLVTLLQVSTVVASDTTPPSSQPDEITIQSVTTNQAQVIKPVIDKPMRPGSPVINGSSQQTVGSWTIEWSNAAAYGTGGGNKYVQHYYAKTRKVSRPAGSYQAEVHATLIDGPSYGGTQVFSYFTHPCAQAIVNNGTAQSCSSPWQLSSTGHQWFIISGHYFDIGINGSQDASCPGCIDWVYTTP